jgi:hypothetical protein
VLLVSFTAGSAFAADAGMTINPLNKIKARSAEVRWGELNHLWGNVESAARDLPQDAEIPAVTAEDAAPSELPADAAASAATETAVQAVPVRYVQQQQAETPSQPYTDTVRDPSQLKRVTAILPYSDYEPNPEISANDPCENLCPRPDGLPCRTYGEGERMPECPEEIRLSDLPYEGRLFPETVFTWEASNLWHNPLYFEDPQLERYGHTHGHCVQPFVSGGRFMAQLMGLPYQMTLHPPCSCRYTLGWYRPGECAPKQIYQIPLNCCAAAVTAGFYTGMIFAIP